MKSKWVVAIGFFLLVLSAEIVGKCPVLSGYSTCIECPKFPIVDASEKQSAPCKGHFISSGQTVNYKADKYTLNWTSNIIGDQGQCILSTDLVKANDPDCTNGSCILWCQYGPEDKLKMSVYVTAPKWCHAPIIYSRLNATGDSGLENGAASAGSQPYIMCQEKADS